MMPYVISKKCNNKVDQKRFCRNIGCSQEFSKCDFIIKYKVYYNEKFNSFRYGLYIKGAHSNYLVGEGIKNAKSVFANSLVSDLIKDGKKNRDIINKLNDLSESFINPLTKNLLLYEKRKLNQKRYYKTKVENGIYENCFQKGYEFFKKNRFTHLKLIKYDEENLTMIFLNSSIESYDLKRLNQIYIDGTFKTKFWLNSHYNLLELQLIYLDLCALFH